MSASDLADLRRALDDLLSQPGPDDPIGRAKHRALTAAIICEAFGRRDMEATLVGGGAIEFHAPGAYATDDLDLIVVGGPGVSTRQAAAGVFGDLGFTRRGRHWERDGLFVELPGQSLDDPVDEHVLGGYVLRVVKPEVVLADRIVGFKHWRYTAYGLQAISMLAAFGDALDEAWLLKRLKREDAVDAYRALSEVEAAGRRVTEAELRAVLERVETNAGRPPEPKRTVGRKKRR